MPSHGFDNEKFVYMSLKQHKLTHSSSLLCLINMFHVCDIAKASFMSLLKINQSKSFYCQHDIDNVNGFEVLHFFIYFFCNREIRKEAFQQKARALSDWLLIMYLKRLPLGSTSLRASHYHPITRESEAKNKIKINWENSTCSCG